MTEQTTTLEGDLFYKSLIHGYVDSPRFIERDWLWQRVQTALKKTHCRFVLLTGEPGSGKSAFMAWIARNHPNWPRYFIRRNQRAPLEDGSARGFLEKTGFQLAARFPEVFKPDTVRLSISQVADQVEDEAQLTGADVKKIIASPFYDKVIDIIQNVRINKGNVTGIRVGELVTDSNQIKLLDLQRMVLLAPALALKKQGYEEPIVILIDALDELRYRQLGGTVLNWLTECPELPANIRILVSSRPDLEWLAAFRSVQQDCLVEEKIPDVGEHIRRDLTEYAGKLFEIPVVSSFLESQKQSEQSSQAVKDEFITTVVEKAKGNLGYLDALGRAIDHAIDHNDQAILGALLELRNLPKTLKNLYAHFLSILRQSVRNRDVIAVDPETRKQSLVNAWSNVYKPVISVLAVAKEPLRSSQIQRLGRMLAGEDDISEAVGMLRQFLDEEQGRYTFYHSTVPEFLTDQETLQNHEYRYLAVDPTVWNGRIVDAYRASATNWDQVDWKNVDDYGLYHLAAHLYELKEDKCYERTLFDLICKPFMEAKLVRLKSHQSFAADIDLAWQVANTKVKSVQNVSRLIQLQMVRGIIYEDTQSYSDLDLKTLVWLNLNGKALVHSNMRPTIKERFEGKLAVYCTMEERWGSNLEMYSEIFNMVKSFPEKFNQVVSFEKILHVFPTFYESNDDYATLLDDILQFRQKNLEKLEIEPLVALAERLCSSGNSNLTKCVVNAAVKEIDEKWPHAADEKMVEWFSRLGAALSVSSKSEQADYLLQRADKIVLARDRGLIHITAYAATFIVKTLFRLGQQARARQLIHKVEMMVRRIYKEEYPDEIVRDQYPEALSWIGAMWVCIGDNQYGEACFCELDEQIFELIKQKQSGWEHGGPYNTKERILEAMLLARRYKQALQYRAWLGNEFKILIAQAQSAVADNDCHIDIFLNEAEKAVARMPRRLSYQQEEWKEAFSQLMHVYTQTGYLKQSNWRPLYDDGEALSIQAYWVARAGNETLAKELLKLALRENSKVDLQAWNDALQHVAQGLARTGNCGHAQSVTQQIKKSSQRLIAIIELGRSFARAGLTSETDSCFENAYALLLHLMEKGFKSNDEGVLFEAMIEAGRRNLIIDLLEKTNTSEKYDLKLPLFRAILRTKNFKWASEMIEAERESRLGLSDYMAQLLADALILEKQPTDAEMAVISSGSLGLKNSYSFKKIRFQNECFLDTSWGQTLSLLAICYKKQGDPVQCDRILNVLFQSIEELRNSYKLPKLLADLGHCLSGIGKREKAESIFKQAEDLVRIERKGLEDSNLIPYLLEKLLSSGFFPQAQELIRKIMKTVKNPQTNDNCYFMQKCASACSRAGQFEFAQKFINKTGGSTWMKMLFMEASREAIKQKATTAALQLALAWPHWMESGQWAEMLPKLSGLLTKAHRFDDLRHIVTLAKEPHLQNLLRAQLAVGLMRADQINEAFEVLKDARLEYIFIFLGDSSLVFEKFEAGLSLSVLQDATQIAGWASPDWQTIHELLITKARRIERKELST